VSDKDLSPESYLSGSNNPSKSAGRDYAGLDVENIAPDEAELEVLKEEARNDLLFYMQTCDPNYIISKVHGLIARKLMAVAEGSIRRLIITVPPRVGKSRCSCIEFPSWTYGKYSKKEFIISGHNTDLPVKSSRACRNRMADIHTYQEIFDTRIAAGNAGVEEWSTSNGGSYMAVGMGGGVLGRGADVFILDDIVKGFEMAHSANQLEKAWGWMWTDVFTRLSPTGAVILIMSRLSVDDPIGRMLDPKRIAKMEADNDVLASEKWEVINLPALAGQNDPLGRKPGESIFPERWSADKYRNIRATSLAYVWAAMYDGNPVVMGGNYIPVACFQIIEPNQLPDGLRWFRSWDLATRADQIHDETATVSGAMDGSDNLYLRNMEHGRWNWPETRTRIKQMAVAERIIIGIEAVAGFDTAYQNVLEVLPATITCLSLGVHKDKLTRALPWIELVAKKKVFLVAGPWITDFLLQAERFAGKKDGEDDMIDTVSLVYQLCRSGGQRIMPVTINDRLTHARQERSRRELDG
jgi:predicted phage terminase large subunit-like protein